jgi:quinol monooxygenase YgiN
MDTAPTTLVASYQVKPGAEEALRHLSRQYAAAVAEEPGTYALGLYLDDAGTYTHIQMSADTEAFEAHMRQIREFLGQAFELVETVAIDVYGVPGPILSEAVQRNREAGATVSLHRDGVAGFGRLPVDVASGR